MDAQCWWRTCTCQILTAQAVPHPEAVAVTSPTAVSGDGCCLAPAGPGISPSVKCSPTDVKLPKAISVP